MARFSRCLTGIVLALHLATADRRKDSPKNKRCRRRRGFRRWKTEAICAIRGQLLPSWNRLGAAGLEKFDADATRADFAHMKALGVNCVRVFLSYGSFYHQSGILDTNGLAKFDQFLSIAEAAGIYVHPTGPDLWEGPPDWPVGGIGDEKTLASLEAFGKCSRRAIGEGM